MTKKEQRLRDELEMIDWGEVWSSLPTERCDEDDESDAIMAKALGPERWEEYCRVTDAKLELTIYLCGGGYLS
jgi:hypothetical protein